MQLIELHVLQSYPVSCLNRDDNGSPKSARFGGVNRARLSSQCLKRAARDHARQHYPAARFGGVRSRRLVEPFVAEFQKLGLSEADARTQTDAVRNALSKVDGKDKDLVTTAVFLSPAEIAQVAAAVKGGADPAKALKKSQRLDAADIALFGRMIANDASLNVEAASLFSHALSVHAADNEVDFFSAIDENRGPDAEDQGAGMIGTLEFNAAVYYRYVGLNLGLLADADHLGGLSAEDRRAVVGAFLRSVLLAVPGARQATMNADTRPGFVLGLYRNAGQPLQLVNAFLEPVAKGRHPSLLAAAREKLVNHHQNLTRVWENPPDAQATLAEDGDKTLSAFIEELTTRVP